LRTPGSDARQGRLRALVFVLIAGAVLVGLWHVFKPAAPARTAVAAASGARSIDWVLRDGQLVSGPEIVQATVGETLLLRVRGNQRDELHVHGYDVTRDLPADHLVALELPLTHSGRFDVELHHSHQVLTVLEVQPR